MLSGFAKVLKGREGYALIICSNIFAMLCVQAPHNTIHAQGARYFMEGKYNLYIKVPTAGGAKAIHEDYMILIHKQYTVYMVYAVYQSNLI